nr:hypothetical protein [uncultured Draconibacterium sp.]
MKLLAIEKEVEGANWSNADDLLKNEAHHVFELYLSDILREIYFTENKNAVLILEAKDKPSAKKILDSFPLVKSGKIKFDLMELRPYNGFERIMNSLD